tara:strand:+ start:502 stop:900 length:399 start_codon:yes stop_codon:yes gene_type:complete
MVNTAQEFSRFVVQRMEDKDYRKDGPAACMSLLYDYAKHAESKKFAYKDLSHHKDYTSCEDNWLMAEYAFRCGDSSSMKNIYNHFRNNLKSLDKDGFIKFTAPATGNFIKVLPPGDKWVANAVRLCEASNAV